MVSLHWCKAGIRVGPGLNQPAWSLGPSVFSRRKSIANVIIAEIGNLATLEQYLKLTIAEIRPTRTAEPTAAAVSCTALQHRSSQLHGGFRDLGNDLVGAGRSQFFAVRLIVRPGEYFQLGKNIA